jgi:hypothetical protein
LAVSFSFIFFCGDTCNGPGGIGGAKEIGFIPTDGSIFFVGGDAVVAGGIFI